MTGMSVTAEVTGARLEAANTEAEMANWLMVHKSYDSNRYSSLNEINKSTIGDLSLAFAIPVGGYEPSGFGMGYMEGNSQTNTIESLSVHSYPHSRSMGGSTFEIIRQSTFIACRLVSSQLRKGPQGSQESSWIQMPVLT